MTKLPPTELARRRRDLLKFNQYCMEGSPDGVFQLVIARLEQVPALLASPEPLHQAVVQAVITLTDAILKGARPLCLLCDHEFKSPAVPPTITQLTGKSLSGLLSTIPPACALLLPYRSDIEQALSSPLCDTCCRQSDADLTAAATIRYRKTWPKLRRLELSPPPISKQ